MKSFACLSILILFSLIWHTETDAKAIHEIDCKQILENLEMHTHAALGASELSFNKNLDGEKLEGRMFFSMSHESVAIAADWASVYSAICK